MNIEVKVPDHIDRYISGLSSTAEKEQIDAYIRRQSGLGHILRRPVSAALKKGINELRPGPIRILFFYHKGEITLIHAFRKTTRAVPDREIKAAIRLREKYINGEIK